ncbi:ATP-binding cassette domain-containing protein [Microbacterium sp. G2-8]|uniref:ATP-binding cassette domain-containing protein n=1 Tax=Microbacterium sp. G2-8 TaxID=2842454 RepID=UPI001C8A3BCC|nr:ATP-binding cassette domain-containing protein [Microbacterium sp. G2-8]
MTHAIEAHGLTKRFPAGKSGSHTVLDGLDLDVPTGGVFALLGPNGAGKTTAINIFSTLLRPDAGTVRIDGHDVAREPAAVRSAIGVTGQFSAVDTMLTGEENLQLMADLRHLGRKGRGRVAELLERFELTDAAKKPLLTYSGGMTRRLDLAMTLVSRPKIVFLDEPTTGLDPRSRRSMWDFVGEIVRDGVTILLTTQYLDEADALADRIAVLDGGSIVAEGSPNELKRRVPGSHIRLAFGDDARVAEAASLFADARVVAAERALQVPSIGGYADVSAVVRRLDGAGIVPESLDIHTPDLDDVFFALTGHGSEVTETEEVAR